MNLTTDLLDPVEEERRAARIEAEAIRACFTPPPDLSILDYAERYRELAAETGARGRWRVDQVPYLRDPLLALSDPRVREVTIMKPAQSGATEGIVINSIFYHVDYDPAAMLVMYPTEGEAEKFSKKKLMPAIEATQRIAEKVSDPRARKGGSNTILEKVFPGGSIGIISGASSRGFRMVSARFVIGDDIDGLDPAVDEGDQIRLLRKRMLAYWNAKALWVSSPGDARTSRIKRLYDESERRGRFHVPCPHCEQMQELRFGGPDTPYGLKWESELVDGRKVHRPDTVVYLCEHCGCAIDESHKYWMASHGQYIAENDGEPLLSKPARSYGFWYRGFVSLFPGVAWPEIVREFLAVKSDPVQLKVLVNTIFAETFEERAEKPVDANTLELRAEAYVDAAGQRIEVPDGVAVLTAFVDVQNDRLELLIRGWGELEISWMIAHHRIFGDPARPDVWRELEAWRLREYRHASGALLRIDALGIDSGDGNRKNEVYDYVRPRQTAGVVATKGQGSRQREPIKLPAKADKTGIRLLHIGTHPMKATLFAHLKLQLEPGKPTPPGYMHFRAPDPEWHNGADHEFFEQFTREEARPKRLPNGQWVTEYVQIGPNEAIDLEVGNLAMLHALGPRVRESLGQRAQQIRAAGPKWRGGRSRRRQRGRVHFSATDS